MGLAQLGEPVNLAELVEEAGDAAEDDSRTEDAGKVNSSYPSHPQRSEEML